MAKKAYIEGDLVLRVEDDIDQEMETVPPSFESLGAARLRWDETDVVDANDYTAFFIANDGVKHIQNLHPDSTALTPNTETLTLNRRGAANDDEITRTTGSFVTDGFIVGMWLSVEGSASGNNIPLKVKTVTALQITIDETVSRITIDEGPKTGLTLHGGWQRLEGITFASVLQQDANGLWSDRSDADLQSDDEATYKQRIERAANRHVDTSWSTEGKLKEDGETQAAFAKIIAAGDDTADALHSDMTRVGDRIYDEDSHSLSGVDLTFDATARTITRATGDFTTDGWKRYCLCTVAGSTSNNGNLAIKAVGTTTLTVSDLSQDDLVNEGPAAGITLNAIASIVGYKRGEGTSTIQREIVIRRGVINRWIDDTRGTEKTALGQVKASTQWAGSTAYVVGDSVWLKSARKFYVCNTNHTSAVDFATDVAKWDVLNPEALSFPSFPATQLES